MEVYFEGTIGIRKWLRIRKNRISTLEELTKLVIKHEPRELTIHINSLGGSTYQALAIYFYLLSLSIPVTTFCHGQVASAATIIAQAGKKRYMDKDAEILIHTPRINTSNAITFRLLGIIKEDLAFSNKILKTIFKRKSALTEKQVERVMHLQNEEGVWLNYETALQFKLVDELEEQYVFSIVSSWILVRVSYLSELN